MDGDFGTKLECKVSYNGQEKGNPYIWTLNKKSRNVLVDVFGEPDKPFDTIVLVGHDIPIETAPTEKGRAIFIDAMELRKSLAEKKQEVLN